jgi:hypothetical protein
MSEKKFKLLLTVHFFFYPFERLLQLLAKSSLVT